MTKKTLVNIANNFYQDLKKASQGKKSSLSFIKNTLPEKPLVAKEEIFQVMVIGGSVLKSTLLKSSYRKTTILSQKKEQLPLLKNKKTLFLLIEKHLHPKINCLALNFAFPLKPKIRENLLDGQLLKATKEHQLIGLLNNLAGRELEKYIYQRKKRKIKITIANDTICLLLSGLSKARWSNLIAGVVGTGINFAFFTDKKTAVNLESGNFNRFPQTKTGNIIDLSSSNPGEQLFEKEVAGAYLYQHYNLSNYLLYDRDIDNTFQLNQLAQKGNSLAKKLLQRSASLIACQIAGIYFFKNFKFQISNLKLIMEGSLFWLGYHYQDYVKNYLQLLEVPKKAINFIKVKNSDIIGTAQLVINNHL